MELETQTKTAPEHCKEYPLSLFQERLWFIRQKNPLDIGYNLPAEFLIEGPLDREALFESLATIVSRHRNLRARFALNNHGEPVQIIGPAEDFSLPLIEVGPDEIESHVKRNKEHVFDIDHGPVFIAKLLHVGPEKHLLLLNMHHIVADGWSIEGILFSELQECYRAFCGDKTPALPALTALYSDFAAWQRSTDLASDLSYWQESLAGYEDSLELPADFMRGPQTGRSSAVVLHSYSREFSRNLRRFAQEHGCTLFMCLLAGFGLTVSRYTGRTDLCIGTTTSGRSRPEFENLIGFFINILPLRLGIDEEGTVDDFMEAVRKLSLSGFDHQAVPFERLLFSLGIDRSRRPNALVPYVLRHQNFPHTHLDEQFPGGVAFKPYAGAVDGLPGLFATSAGVTGAEVTARCELELSFTGNADGLYVEAVYASDLYRAETVERILAHQEKLLTEMFANGKRRLADLPMLRGADSHRLHVEYNRTWRAGSSTATFIERFEAQAAKSPDAVACHDAEGPWRYSQVASYVGRLAASLASRGVGPGDLVAVYLDRGVPLITAFLAVWKVGAAYVPLDPSYPESYIRQILLNAEPAWAITTTNYRPKLGLSEDRCFDLDDPARTPAEAAGAIPFRAYSPEALAYVMYTSGSTGTPKGVRVPHRQLINWLSGIEANWPFQAGEVVAQKTTVAFAVSAKELFSGLLNGYPQVVLDTLTVQDMAAFVEALAKHRITRVYLVPSHLNAVLQQLKKKEMDLPDLRLCITAGEPLTAEVVAAFRSQLPHARLLNNYGCTELNDITYFDAQDFDAKQGFVPIGKPIQNTSLYVLDRRGREVPEGVAGELHVATAGMSDGYHNQPQLTQERFLPNPFGDKPSSLLYNTGDVVRFLPGGCLEYIGRWDFQVKVRGFRVDVRQVEKVLGDFPGIGMRAVMGHGEQLVAYYVENGGAAVELGALRGFLQERLPSYMVPDAFVRMESMPRLPNGKFDRRALKPAAGKLQRSDVFAAPISETDRALAAIWSDVLQVPEDDIGLNTNFFEIGGHSLSATRVVARIKERLGMEVGLSQVFENPRLGELSAHIVGLRGKSESEQDAAQEVSVRGEQSGERRSRAPGLVEGKVILVTGSSRGIGSATVRLLASQGAKVAINYVKSESRAQRVKEMIDRDGGVAEVFQADVTDADDVKRLVDGVRTKFGAIDVLVANAAIGFKMASFLQYNWEDFELKLTNELKSIFYLCKDIVPEMIERRSGSIVAVSSSMSKISGGGGFIAHSSAKAALDSFIRGLATELGPDGIRVNTVAPGFTLTDASANLPYQRKDAAASLSPLRRNGLPRDVAGAVLFFASDLSQFITGNYLPVDGGLTML